MTTARLAPRRTIPLARAAQHAGVRRFVFLSSIRAQSGPTAPDVLTEAYDAASRPTLTAAQSLAAQRRGLADLNLDWVALRLVGSRQGPGMTGSLASSCALRACPIRTRPGGLTDETCPPSSLEDLVTAVSAIFPAHAAGAAAELFHTPADPQPLTLSQMLTAMRRGLGRRPALAPRAGCAAAHGPRKPPGMPIVGVRSTLLPIPAALMGLGWAPKVATDDGLEQLMRTRHPK